MAFQPDQQLCVPVCACVCAFVQMPQLKPETISMTGLNLFQHLCNLARLATSALDNASSCEVTSLFSLPRLHNRVKKNKTAFRSEPSNCVCV